MMKRRDLIIATIAGGVALEASGCATLMNLFEKYVPKLRVKSMKVTGMTLSSISTKFICELSNPNPIGFKLDGLDYLLRVAGNELAKGRAPRGVTLKPRQAARTDLDIDFNLGRTAQAILDLIGKKVVPFELQATGKFFTQQTGGIDVPVGYKGSMPMPKTPGFGVKSFTPTAVSASGVTFRIDTSVHNSNDFEIPIDSFHFDVKLDGKKVIDNKSRGGLRVKPGKTETVPLDFRVGLIELGLSLAEIAAGKRMTYEVSTDIKSDRLLVPFKSSGSFRF